MQITVFGGSGKTGQLLLKQALERNHQVVAPVRNPDKIKIKHPNLRVMSLNLDDKDAITKAIEGSEAVLSVLGPVGKDKSKPLTRGVKNIISAMKALGVRRYIQVATPSNVDPADKFDLKVAISRVLIRTVANSAYHEILSYGDLVRESGLDWTLVRVPWLNDGEVAPVKARYIGSGQVGMSLSRASMTKFMLDELDSGQFIQRAPAISN